MMNILKRLLDWAIDKRRRPYQSGKIVPSWKLFPPPCSGTEEESFMSHFDKGVDIRPKFDWELDFLGFARKTHGKDLWWMNDFDGWIHSGKWAVPVHIHVETHHWYWYPDFVLRDLPPGDIGGKYHNDNAWWCYDVEDSWMDAPDAPPEALRFKQALLEGRLGRHWNTREQEWKPPSWRDFLKKVCTDLDGVFAGWQGAE